MISELFWGFLIFLFGASMLLKALFGIDIPLVKAFLGILLVYVGFIMISQTLGWPHKRKAILFDRTTIHNAKAYQKYSVVLGSGVFDLRTMALGDEPITIDVTTVFGETAIKLDPAMPTSINLNTMFSQATLPDGTVLNMGRRTFRAGREGEPMIHIRANVVFGSLKIQNA